MKRIEISSIECIQGGSPCHAVAGAILFFGFGAASVPTPITWALGGVSIGLGALATASCYW